MSQTNRTLLRGVAVAAAALCLGACSTTNFSSMDAAYKQQGTVAAVQPLTGSALVVVRWPQAVTESAQALLKPNWVSRYNDLVWNNPVSIMGFDGIHDAYQGIPAGSIYYAAEFTRLLGRYIPSADIALEPLILDAENGKLVYRPLVRNRFPARMVVDLWDVPLTHKGSTHGSAQVIASVSTAGLASAKTCGVLAYKPALNIMPAFDAAACPALEARDVPHPDVIYGFAGDSWDYSTPIPTKAGVPLAPDAAVAFPQTYEPFSKAYYEASAAPDFDADGKLRNETLDNLARVVADGLTRIDAAQATRVAFDAYVARYDKPLAERLAARTPAPGDEAKLKLISQLADAERKWVAAQDRALVAKLLDGAYGKSFRAMRLAKEKQGARQQMMSMAGAFAMAGAGMASGAFSGAGAFNAQMGNTMALQAAMQYYSVSGQATTAFYEQFGAEMAAQDRLVQIEIGGKQIGLQADNRARLYEEAGKIYQTAFGGATEAPKPKPAMARRAGGAAK